MTLIKLNENMENNHVYLKIYAESIYLHSISILTFYSAKEFEITLSPEMEIIQLIKGKQKTLKTIISQKGDGKNNIIEVSIIGFFEERKIFLNNYNNELGAHYGMRFYPFISSIIRGTISCSRKFDHVSIILPDVFRFIFFQSEIKQNDRKSILRQSYGKDFSNYIFTWKDEFDGISKYVLKTNVPVRLGGRSLLRIIKFPIYYWLVALLGVAILSSTDKASVVIGAVVAAWLFMLQRWDSSSLPQQETILTGLYLIFGAILGLWGMMWILIGKITSLLIVPILIVVYIILEAIRLFNETGELPGFFAEWYAKKVIKKDKKREIMSYSIKTEKNIHISAFSKHIRRPVHS